MKVGLIHPATFKLDGGAMFGIIPRPLWSKKIQPDEYNRISMSLRIMYIETHDRKIIVDTGIGEDYSEKFKEQFAIKSETTISKILKNNLNITPNDITDVVLTHLHFDHVGGLGFGGKPLFPNAKIHLHKNHYEYALNPSMRDAGSFHSDVFGPLINFYKANNKINFLEDMTGEILPGLNYKISKGHTPWMIHPYTDKYIYMADLVPMSHHVHIPWVMGYDIEPAVTTKFKSEFYDFITQKKLKMIYEHDIDACYGSLIKDNKKRYKSSDNYQSYKSFCWLD